MDHSRNVAAGEERLLIFGVNGVRCALPLGDVTRVERAAAVTPLPNSPGVVAGVINVRGRILPVMDVGYRLGFGEREMVLEDHLILARTTRREMALWVGVVEGVEFCTLPDQGDVCAEVEKLPGVGGITTLGDDLVLIYDLERFLSDAEDAQLGLAMKDVGD